MSFLVAGKGIYIPRNDHQFVQQATKPIYQVLGLEEKECCAFLKRLEKEHKSIADMCTQALVPNYAPKTNEIYIYSILKFAGIGCVLASLVRFSAFKTHFLFGAVMGALYGVVAIYFAPLKDLKENEVSIKAGAEKMWLKSKQPEIEENLKTALAEVKALADDDFEKDEKKEVIAKQNQLLLLSSYLKSVIGRGE